jgi:hypothetical protein
LCYNGSSIEKGIKFMQTDEIRYIKSHRDDIIFMLSFKGFTTDALMLKSDEELDNLYIEYIILAEDYV